MILLDQPLSYPGKYESLGKKALCPICGTEFIKKCANHKYCSKKCSYQAALERNKKWQEEHRDRMLLVQKRYREKNKDRMRRYKQEYRKNNPQAQERDREYSRKWRTEHREYAIKRSRFYNCSKKHDKCETCPYDDCLHA